MARWRICDDDWYWFIPFETDEVEPHQKETNARMGLENWSQMNLWRCRHCAAMIPGDGRLEHEHFHEMLDERWKQSLRSLDGRQDSV